ncbi:MULTISPECIES: hypothetical protein [Methanothermococcus]|uniref:hypothetical protein n=1 Tax=Methanothermococcus TaxID=155862 RepID=UPI00037ECE38|nr:MULTISPECIES: hypothetical protein [Methanothermococcus]
MMKKEYIILFFIIMILAISPLILLEYQKSRYTPTEELKRFGVYSIEKKTIENKDVIIAYQIKNKIENRLPGDIDPGSKVEICYITWYLFNNFEDRDEVQIISYYNNSGKLAIYYKFKIDRRDAEVAGILDVPKSEIFPNVYYYYRKIIKLGTLKVKDVNIPYWRRVNNGNNNTYQ